MDRGFETEACRLPGYYNTARSHAALDGHTPLTVAGAQVVAPADLNKVRRVSHCRDLVQLPVAA